MPRKGTTVPVVYPRYCKRTSGESHLLQSEADVYRTPGKSGGACKQCITINQKDRRRSRNARGARPFRGSPQEWSKASEGILGPPEKHLHPWRKPSYDRMVKAAELRAIKERLDSLEDHYGPLQGIDDFEGTFDELETRLVKRYGNDYVPRLDQALFLPLDTNE